MQYLWQLFWQQVWSPLPRATQWWIIAVVGVFFVSGIAKRVIATLASKFWDVFKDSIKLQLIFLFGSFIAIGWWVAADNAKAAKLEVASSCYVPWSSDKTVWALAVTHGMTPNRLIQLNGLEKYQEEGKSLQESIPEGKTIQVCLPTPTPTPTWYPTPRPGIIQAWKNAQATKDASWWQR